MVLLRGDGGLSRRHDAVAGQGATFYEIRTVPAVPEVDRKEVKLQSVGSLTKLYVFGYFEKKVHRRARKRTASTTPDRFCAR